MSDLRSNDVLLVLSGHPWPAGEDGADAMLVLTGVMDWAGCQELHLLHVREFKTPSFVWPLLIEFRLLSDPDEEARAQRAHSLRAEVIARCEWLEHDALQFLWLTQSRFGEEHDGASLIVSLYSWQAGTSSAERERDMWIHFDMEREEPDYTAVHFNTSNGTEQFDNGRFDFVFQAYVDDLKGMSRIYGSARLEAMREHSRTFLNTDTRRLGFGEVQIITR